MKRASRCAKMLCNGLQLWLEKIRMDAASLVTLQPCFHIKHSSRVLATTPISKLAGKMIWPRLGIASSTILHAQSRNAQFFQWLGFHVQIWARQGFAWNVQARRRLFTFLMGAGPLNVKCHYFWWNVRKIFGDKIQQSVLELISYLITWCDFFFLNCLFFQNNFWRN